MLSKFDIDRHSVSNFIKVAISLCSRKSKLCQGYWNWGEIIRLERTGSYPLKTLISFD